VPILTEDANDEPGIENILHDTLTLPRKIKGGTQSADSKAAFEGYVEFYGYHSLAEGWCFSGWITRQENIADYINRTIATFNNDRIEAEVLSLTFPRSDITSWDAIGFLIFLKAPFGSTDSLQTLGFCFDDGIKTIPPVEGAHALAETTLSAHLGYVLSLAEPGLPRETMDVTLNGRPEDALQGYIEYLGYHSAAAGWFFAGWINRGWGADRTPDRILVSFEDGELRGNAIATLYNRADLPADAKGAIFFLPGTGRVRGALKELALCFGDTRVTLTPIDNTRKLRDAELTTQLKANLGQALPGLNGVRLKNILKRRPYSGEDTLETLSPSLFLYIDHAILCGPRGLVLMGWMLARPDEMPTLRVHCGSRISLLQPQTFVKIDRQDVLEQFTKHGFDDTACGFIAYLPEAVEPDARIYIEAETHRYEIGYRNIPAPVPSGMAAIRQLLGSVDVRFGDLAPAFDHVLGPAVEAMNEERLSKRVGRQVVEFGAVPRTPKFSVIVPLYGRLDFVEYQMGLFSARPENAEVEWVFVLDDPPKRREAQHLFAAVYERFQIPFRTVLLERNLGFAPANNVGMEYCHGEYLVYLNSDVFPGTADWLDRLASRLEEDPELGVVGPLLLFEDGAVQHRGMYFEQLEEYGNWFFCQHLDKGLRYSGNGEMEYFISITGACMMLRRDLAMQIGGFDETYVIGDFEDSDLCLKLVTQGYKCGVDPSVVLYHLERKSQLSGALTWRANLTAYNAWQHERRWAKTIAQKQMHEFKVPE